MGRYIRHGPVTTVRIVARYLSSYIIACQLYIVSCMGTVSPSVSFCPSSCICCLMRIASKNRLLYVSRSAFFEKSFSSSAELTSTTNVPYREPSSSICRICIRDPRYYLLFPPPSSLRTSRKVPKNVFARALRSQYVALPGIRTGPRMWK